jgi:hypothetical protein
VLNCSLISYHKGRWFISTAGRWSWKSKSANECVTQRSGWLTDSVTVEFYYITVESFNYLIMNFLMLIQLVLMIMLLISILDSIIFCP